jgi:hypothetical protein
LLSGLWIAGALPAIAAVEQIDAAPIWTVTQRDSHSERSEALVTVGTRPDGQPLVQRRQFVTLCTGLNYRDEQGNWQRTREEFQVAPDGSAIAQFGPHRLVGGQQRQRLGGGFSDD